MHIFKLWIRPAMLLVWDVLPLLALRQRNQRPVLVTSKQASWKKVELVRLSALWKNRRKKLRAKCLLQAASTGTRGCFCSVRTFFSTNAGVTHQQYMRLLRRPLQLHSGISILCV
ncbi:mannose-1-phosphate guanylyltransferase rfbM domain protein [Brucella abortus]|nr:mannose-1-phosphate guanylyltransferase rfbM domain protein [Brucella abortus]